MATREFNFTVGPETSTQPDVGTPTSDDDLLTRGYADDRYPNGSAAGANIAAIKAVTAAERQDGDLMVAMDINTLYLFDAGSAVAGDDDFVLAPDAGTGRWLKVSAAGTAATAFDDISPTTTKGDVIVHNGTNNVRLGVGTNGQVIKAASGQTEGIAWENLDVDLASEVTGILPVANGGTNSSTALNNNRMIISSSGSIVEQSAITASRALVSDGSGLPAAASTTTTQVNYLSSSTGTTGTTSTNLVFSASPILTGAIGLDGAVVINDSGADVDIRVESSTETNFLFLDGGSSTIGIGEAAGSAKLSVAATTAGGVGLIDFKNTSNTSGAGLNLRSIVSDNGTGTYAYDNITYRTGVVDHVNGATSPVENFYAGSTLLLTLTSSGVVINENGSAIDFRVEGDTDASLLVVDASADAIGIGTTTPEYKFHMEHAAATDLRMLLESNNASANPVYQLRNNANQNSYMYLNTSGEVLVTSDIATGVKLASGATAWSSASDRRMKQNITDVSGCLDAIRAVKPRRWKWIKGQRNDVGFVAQELKEVIPEAVFGKEEDWKGEEDKTSGAAIGAMSVAPTMIIPHLVGAIKELDALVTSLQNRIAALEAR